MFESHPYLALMKRISNHFSSAGHEIYVVGGIVRDELLGEECHDIDFTTSATPDEISGILESLADAAVFDLGGDRFGCVAAQIDGVGVEITTYRTESYSETGGRRPNVAYSSSLEADLARRDFTINSMAYDFQNEKLIDIFDGRKDLENRCIRAIGNPVDRFREDPLRMLRAVRFSGQLDAYIDIYTYVAILKMSSRIRTISMERIRDELVKSLLTVKPSRGLYMMCDLGLIDHFMPEVLPLIGCSQPKQWHRYDVFGHTTKVINEVPRSSILRLAALFHDIGKPATKQRDKDGVIHFYEHHKESAKLARIIMMRLKFSTHQIETVCHVVYNHMKPHCLNDDYTSVRRFVNRSDLFIGDTLVVPSEMIVDFALCDAIASGVSNNESESRYFRIKELCAEVRSRKEDATVSPLTGDQIMDALGVGPCRIVGKVKKLLVERVVDGVLPAGDAEAALAFIETDVKPGLFVTGEDLERIA